MRSTATSAVTAVSVQNGQTSFITDPSPRQVEQARSVHVLAFTSLEELLLAESEGDFTMDEWDHVYSTARSICCKAAPQQEVDMILGEDQQPGPDLRRFIRAATETKITADLHWK